jgi:2-dehydro-3-deoxyphosphooctonate aldolase (KDO 8-P synthase)
MSGKMDPLAFLFDASRPFVIAGPCAMEDYGLALEVGRECKRVCKKYGVPYVFKSSFDKANRLSAWSYRGPGLIKGLDLIRRLKRALDVPVLSDVHEVTQVEKAATVLDILQIPALLSRQTDLLTACGQTGKVVNIKKGQFMAPLNMREAVEKVTRTGNRRVLVTERGVSFGYNNLVVDFTALPILKSLGKPVVYDATHSLQVPGEHGSHSGGRPSFAPLLAAAAAAVGVDGFFFEVHPRPGRALSDGSSMLSLKGFDKVLGRVLAHDAIRRGR